MPRVFTKCTYKEDHSIASVELTLIKQQFNLIIISGVLQLPDPQIPENFNQSIDIEEEEDDGDANDESGIQLLHVSGASAVCWPYLQGVFIEGKCGEALQCRRSANEENARQLEAESSD
ncbi:unnamed protein product [Heligmosomoides polygyrus]|uniref:Uncharacterized protein n=1 Tax=Heligmosomoides polygyrus TaxID=6339 RepID=A0A183G3N1_HELPZ|nr:unnamed protein product [Heligmosomoides polygyrus]